MNYKIFLPLILGIFLLSAVSATIVVDGFFQGDIYKTNAVINNGNSIVLNIILTSSNSVISGEISLPSGLSSSGGTCSRSSSGHTYSCTYTIIANNPGVYTIGITGKDDTGSVDSNNNNPLTLTVNPLTPVVDTIPPVITILGSNPLTIVKGNPYIELGATAADNVDGNLTSSIIVTGNVNTSVTGTYNKIYSATDSSGNTGTATRTINVINPPIGNNPVITILGSNPITIQAGFAYNDAGATASDVEDVNLTASITKISNVNTSLLGNYTVIYSVTDSSGNNATATRNVNVVDTTAPVVTLIGASSVTITKGGTYTEFNATALDNYNGVLPVTFTGSVNVNSIGTYTITYTAADSSGNIGTAARTVHVESSGSSSSSRNANSNIVSSPAVVPEKKSESISLPPINLGGQQSSNVVWTSLVVMIIILILGAIMAILVLRRKR